MSKSESRLEKIAREGALSMPSHEADARAVREKTSRLRALRLSRDAAEAEAAVCVEEKSDGSKSRKVRKPNTSALDDD